MKRSEFEIGEFLVTESDSKSPGRVFIHNGYINGDGYGVVIGETADGIIERASGWGNFCKGCKVRRATDNEKEHLIRCIMSSDKIHFY